MLTLIEQYFIYVRAKITPKHPTFQNRFLLTNTGNEFSKVGECMKDAVKTFGLLLPTVGLQRQVATEVYKTEGDVTVRGVQKQCTTAQPPAINSTSSPMPDLQLKQREQ